jgi:integrase
LPEELRDIPKDTPEPKRSKLRSEAAKWRAAHTWSPNQLRHTFATDVRKRFGLEAAQVLLGHSEADTTQLYAERDAERAVAVMLQVG